jgi:hypothetical protein
MICPKKRLCHAEVKLSTLEPKAEQARELECEISSLKTQIRRLKCDNELLADTNELQARIIKSRPSSPCAPAAVTVTHCSRSASPVNVTVISSSSGCATPRLVRSTSTYNCATVCVEAKPSSLSPLSPNNCTQVIRQESLINRFNNLYCRDRQHAVSTLKCYVSDTENINRIVFAAVQEAFSIAKRSFCDWKIKVRSSLCLTHCGLETLEEAVQNYVNRNVDMYDLPCMVSVCYSFYFNSVTFRLKLLDFLRI